MSPEMSSGHHEPADDSPRCWGSAGMSAVTIVMCVCVFGTVMKNGQRTKSLGTRNLDFRSQQLQVSLGTILT